MSKGSVWNKGKHNGGKPAGGTKSKDKVNAKSSSQKQVQAVPTDGNGGVRNERITTVKRMNRENWVVRPARVVHNNERNEAIHTTDETIN